MNREIEYWVATSAMPGVGTVTFDYLLKFFKSLKAFWHSSDEEINKLKLDSRAMSSIIDFRKKVEPKVFLSKVYDLGIKVTSKVDRDFPANLRQIVGCPPVLYYRGTLTARDDLSIAVVGSRAASVYGRQVTENLVSSLVMSGLVVVSGLARGIDSVAHRTALDAGGRTIAVLGCGLDMVYPPENRKLAEVVAKNGAVVSEFPLGFPPVQSNFAARNRIISGLSLGVLVTEAAVNSGSLITAGHAAEQGREVFAVPGPITSINSHGVNKLLKEGVHPVTEAADILEVLDIRRKSQRNEETESRSPKDKVQEKILQTLDGEAKHIDKIAVEAKMPIEKVSSALSLMELSGFVKNYGSGIWGK